MSDPFDDPKLKAYFRHAEDELFPKLQQSGIGLTMLGKPDPKLCLELGAMILFDKPIIVLVPRGERVPANLKRVAAAIVEGDPKDPGTFERLQDAIRSVKENDRRSRS